MNRRSIRDFSPGPELAVVCFLRIKPKLDERDSHDMLSLRDHDDFAVIIPGRLMYSKSFAIYDLLDYPGVKQRLRPNDKRRGRFTHNVVASFSSKLDYVELPCAHRRVSFRSLLIQTDSPRDVAESGIEPNGHLYIPVDASEYGKAMTVEILCP